MKCCWGNEREMSSERWFGLGSFIPTFLGQSVYPCCPGVPFTLKDIPVYMINYMAILLVYHYYKTGFYIIDDGESTGRR